LHRGFERLPQRTQNPLEADVFVVAGYLHLYNALHPRHSKEFVPLYRKAIIDPSKPHLLLIPTWNPKVSRDVGIYGLVNMMKAGRGIVQETNLWTVGFERNPQWQNLNPARILPIPYVVQQNVAISDDAMPMEHQRKQRLENFVFYAGDARKNAEAWAGCFRTKLISSLLQTNRTHQDNHNNRDNISSMDNNNMELHIVSKDSRLNQTVYNERMRSSDYCLILCGDTPTSRSLTSAMIGGCIPIRVGSRLRGLCEPPCHKGYGWTVTGGKYPHLPFADRIPWQNFPEVKEEDVLQEGKQALQKMFEKYTIEKKTRLRSIMDQVRSGWIYGWGDPVTSEKFGDAAMYVWESFEAALRTDNIIS